MATIYTMGGEPIAEATLELPVNGTTAQLRGLPRANGLLNYYFVHGGRKVLVETDEGRLEGRLNTRWERFGRAWEVDLLIPAVPTFRPDLDPFDGETESGLRDERETQDRLASPARGDAITPRR